MSTRAAGFIQGVAATLAMGAVAIVGPGLVSNADDQPRAPSVKRIAELVDKPLGTRGAVSKCVKRKPLLLQCLVVTDDNDRDYRVRISSDFKCMVAQQTKASLEESLSSKVDLPPTIHGWVEDRARCDEDYQRKQPLLKKRKRLKNLKSSSNSSPSDPDFCGSHRCISNFSAGKGSVVRCTDGTYSHSGGQSGACSWHGGVE